MARKNKRFNWIYKGGKNPYDEFLDKILPIVRQENNYRVGAIAYCSAKLFDLKYWENRRKNGYSWLKVIEIGELKVLILGSKMKLGELIEILDDMDIKYQAKKLTQGLDIEGIFRLRREGKRLYLTPTPQVIKDFLWRQVRNLHTSKVWTVGIMLYKLNTIRRKFYEKFKDVYIPYPQLRKWDNYVSERFDKWMTTKKVKKAYRERTLQNLFKFSDLTRKRRQKPEEKPREGPKQEKPKMDPITDLILR